MKNKHLFLLLVSFIFSSAIYAQSTPLSSLDSLIYKKRSYNMTAKKGFRIQLYNGDEKTAMKKIETFNKLFPEISIYRTYKIPEWKVQTEAYKTRLAADRVLNLIKKKYPGARVL